MKITIIFFTFLSFSFISLGQDLTGNELLEKAIKYHDPNNNWETFDGSFSITMESPNNSNRESNIIINLPKEFFHSKSIRDKNSTEFILEKGKCKILFNGKSDFSEAIAKDKKLNCERAIMYKNYYTYLYGLPMKLKDPGTILHNETEKKFFKGKEYFVLKVSYEEEIGKDVWYFYFDPTTYAMEVYQFYHDEAKNDGEYILLSDLEVINGIKMPKIRAWYTNKENKLLGTDFLH